MKQYYLGVKIVEACEHEHDGQPGYAVKYPDGYTSWSPKDVFERSYLPMGNDGSKVSPEMIAGMMDSKVESRRVDDRTLMMIAATRTGFRFYETSSCVDPENYDEAVGEEITAGRIANRMWELLGFVVAWGKNGLTR